MRVVQPARVSGHKFLGCLCLLALGFVSAASPVLASEIPWRVFLLEGLNASEPAAQQAAEAVKQRLKERSSEDIEVYSDFLDLGRFQGPTSENQLVQFLGAKFAQVRPDVVIPMNRSAVDFVVRHRGEFVRDIPIVYCCAPALMTDAIDIPLDIPGVVVGIDWPGTLALAQRLQPNAKTLVIISGASNTDRRREQESLRELQPLLQKYETKFLTGLPYDQLLKEVSRLPRDSIVLLRRVFEDGSGRSRGAAFAEDVSKASAAPIYSASPTYIGFGIVGGRMDSFAEQGARVADLALDILAGKSPSSLPHQTVLPLQYRVDARQLDRWGLDWDALPSQSSVEFRQSTLWQEYPKTIIFVLWALATQVGVIALLLLEIRKRREAENARKTAEAEADVKRKELAHMMRVATVGELSGGIAHELGQPLAAILANAQAAQILLAGRSRNPRAIAEILEDIVQEDSRAGEIIQRLRRLLKKGEQESTPIDLNEKIESSLALLRSELVNKRIKVQTEMQTDLPPISGDRVQLEQVFLNLMMNAMDAMASTPPSHRTLSIGTRATDEGYVEVSITDRGPGMSPDELKRVLEPFFTTKEHGLGLGLSICATIVRSHRGRLNLSNASGGGVTAIVSLPLPLHLVAAS